MFRVKCFMGVMLLVFVYLATYKLKESDKETSERETDDVVIAIDAGHGGMDSGAVSVLSDLEKDINLKIAIKLKEKLEEKGYVTVMTRQNDEGLYDDNATNKKTDDLKKRCEIINNANPVLMVSIHQNIYQSEGVWGAQVFYYEDNREGEEFAKILQNELKVLLNNDNKREAKGNKSYYILKNVNCMAVLVECGFLSNYEEAGLLRTEAYQEKIADAIQQGIEKYLKKSTKK